MEFIKNYSKALFERLSVLLGAKIISGGLEVTDQVVRFVFMENGEWRVHAVRLEPGILERGKIKDKDRLLGSLLALKTEVLGPDGKNKKMAVTLVIGEETIYNQIFILPVLKGPALESAIRLNMQMASPMDISRAYAGWQVVGRDEQSSRLEVLAAFADKQMIDELIAVLFEAHFIPTAIESKALALTRVTRELGVGIDKKASYLLLNVDDTGLSFLIIRGGQLYFEYGDPWRDLVDDKGAISFEKFKESLAVGLRQVMNFYLQHWNDNIVGVVISGSTFLDEVESIVGATLALSTFPLSLEGKPLGTSEWFPATGGALRAIGKKGNTDITLLGEGARDIFFRDRIVHFLSFWRVAVPTVLGGLMLLFGLAYFFLTGIEASLAPYQSTENKFTPIISQELDKLQPQVEAFNRSVSLIKYVQTSEKQQGAILQAILNSASSTAITINKVTFSGGSEPLFLSGDASSQDQIVAFRTALSTAGFTDINLPLTNIQSDGATYSFSMKLSGPAQ